MLMSMVGRDYFVIGLAILAVIQPIWGEDSCPFGWTHDARRDRCIKILDELMEWDNATISCRSCGGGLIRIEDPQDQDLVRTLIWSHEAEGRSKIPYYFIGMNDNETDGQHCMALGFYIRHGVPCTGSLFHYICTRKTGYPSLTGDSYRKEPTGCLDEHYELRGFSSVGPARTQKFRCIGECNREPCCTAIAVGDNECTMYAYNPYVTGNICKGPLHKIFIKKNFK